jgi:hypothetical protein
MGAELSAPTSAERPLQGSRNGPAYDQHGSSAAVQTGHLGRASGGLAFDGVGARLIRQRATAGVRRVHPRRRPQRTGCPDWESPCGVDASIIGDHYRRPSSYSECLSVAHRMHPPLPALGSSDDTDGSPSTIPFQAAHLIWIYMGRSRERRHPPKSGARRSTTRIGPLHSQPDFGAGFPILEKS